MKISIVNERSFSCLGNECVAYFNKWVTKDELMSFFLRSITIPAVGLDVFNAEKAVKQLKGKVLIIYHKKDPLVVYSASLSKAIKSWECKAEKIYRIELINNDTSITNPDNHDRDFTWQENKAVVMTIRKMMGIPISENIPDFILKRVSES